MKTKQQEKHTESRTADRSPAPRNEALITLAQKVEIIRLLNEKWVTGEQKNAMILRINSISEQRAEKALKVMRSQKELFDKAKTLNESLFEDQQLGPLLNAAGFCAGDRVVTEIAEGVVTIQKF